MRTVKVYSTQGQNRQNVTTHVGTWGELQGVLSEYDIVYAGMRAIVGETQNTLESPDAILPDGDFTLFLTPGKVKSGFNPDFASYEELIDFIEERLHITGARDHFSNYTKFSTDQLQMMVKSWITSTGGDLSNTVKADEDSTSDVSSTDLIIALETCAVTIERVIEALRDSDCFNKTERVNINSDLKELDEQARKIIENLGNT